jgi:polysaccharide pyruvyl transferase WcaK-like protein
MDNFYIWGWHGQLNTGDDAFAIVSKWGLKQYANAQKIIMDADLSQVLSKNYGICVSYKKGNLVPGWGRLSRAYHRLIAKGFVLAGGSLLASEAALLKLENDFYWQQAGKKRFAIGVSVGPFQSVRHEQKTIDYLNQMSYVGFRDNFSYDWATFNNIRIPFDRAFDLAVLLPKAIETPSIYLSSEKVLGISLLAFNSAKKQADLARDLQFVEDFARITHTITKENNFKIKLFSICCHPEHQDDLMCQKFKASLPSDAPVEIYKHNGDAYQTLVAMKSCSHFASMRLHGSIFTYINQQPLLLLSYHPKCTSFAQTIGLDSQFCLDVSQFNPEQYRESLQLLLQQTNLNTSLSLAQAQQRALLNFEGLARYL